MSSYEDYDETAKSYDLTRVPMGIDVILGALARAPSPLNEVSLLDAGCGTGSYSAALVDYVGRVSCVDLNEEMLAVARGKLPVDVSIEQAAIDNLPFDDRVFDAIMINQVLHHVADDPKAGYPIIRSILEEFARVLKPGGRLSINTCTHEQLHNGWWYYQLIPDAVQVACDRHVPLETLCELLTQTGFCDEQRYVPVDALMQGDNYFDAKGPLSKTWRDGDSIWACAGDEELKCALSKVQELDRSGRLESYVDEHDHQRRHIGQVTFIFATRA